MDHLGHILVSVPARLHWPPRRSFSEFGNLHNLYYVKSGKAKSNDDGQQCNNAAVMQYRFHSQPSTNNAPDLFGQITVTAFEVVAWVNCVPAFPPRVGSDRWVRYVSDYNVLHKVARAKLENRLSEILDRAPLASDAEITAAADALARLIKSRPEKAAVTIPATAQAVPAPPVTAPALPSAPPRLASVAVLRLPLASTSLADAFIPLPPHHAKAA